jgi:hypothetical protein
MTPSQASGRSAAGVMRTALIAAGLAFAANGAVADEISFRIKFVPEVANPAAGTMIGDIKILKPDSKDWKPLLSIDLPHPGIRATDQIKCDQLGIYFTAEINNALYRLDVQDRKKECRLGEITFTFREKQYAWQLRQAMQQIDFSGLENADKLAYWKTDFENALKNNDTPGMLTSSAQLSEALRTVGAAKKAEPFRIFNLDTAKRTLLGPTAELFFDPQQKKYVLDNEAVTAIKQLQVRENLQASGHLDWNTMKALTAGQM